MNCAYCGHEASHHDANGCNEISHSTNGEQSYMIGCECARDAVQASIAPPEPEE